MSSETLTLSGVPTNPVAAENMLAKISSGEVSPHEDNKDEILERLNLIVSGQLPASDDAEPDPFSYYTRNVTKELKELSVGDFEGILSEALSKRCKAPVSVKVQNFDFSTEMLGGNKLTLSFSVLADRQQSDSDHPF